MTLLKNGVPQGVENSHDEGVVLRGVIDRLSLPFILKNSLLIQKKKIK
jgi:hypothetical protein